MRARRAATRKPVAAASAAVLALLVAAAAAAPLLSPFDPLEQVVDRRLQPPGADHLMGTDGFGRDVLSRVLFGARVSLGVAVASVGAAAILGVLIGSASAYAGGLTDLIVQRVVDLLLGFPALVLAVLVLVIMRPSPPAIGVAVSMTLLPRIARAARAASVVCVSEPYVLAARTIGLGPLRIIARHVVPNIASPVLAQVSGHLGTALVAEATLSYLGLGVPPPYPSLGRMLQEGSRQYFEIAPWVTLFPGLYISLTVICIALLADELRDRLDPRMLQ